MTLDQIFLMYCKKKDLNSKRIIWGTPRELVGRGLIDPSRIGGFAARQAQKAESDEKKSKRERRKSRLEDLKKQLGRVDD